jgi:HEPN domain-containing protein
LAEPIEITLKERRKLAEEDFDFLMKNSNEYLRQYEHAVSDESLNVAAFNLHQVVERLYGSILLVFTRYKPSTHDLEKLGQRVGSVEPKFLSVFPKATEEEQERFKLLRKAYVDARLHNH